MSQNMEQKIERLQILSYGFGASAVLTATYMIMLNWTEAAVILGLGISNINTNYVIKKLGEMIDD